MASWDVVKSTHGKPWITIFVIWIPQIRSTSIKDFILHRIQCYKLEFSSFTSPCIGAYISFELKMSDSFSAGFVAMLQIGVFLVRFFVAALVRESSKLCANIRLNSLLKVCNKIVASVCHMLLRCYIWNATDAVRMWHLFKFFYNVVIQSKKRGPILHKHIVSLC